MPPQKKSWKPPPKPHREPVAEHDDSGVFEGDFTGVGIGARAESEYDLPTRQSVPHPMSKSRRQDVEEDTKVKGKSRAEVLPEGPPFHLDNTELWRAICIWSSDQSGDTQSFANVIHAGMFDVPDFHYLLEAMGCEAQMNARLRDSCIRLYLLRKRSNIDPFRFVPSRKERVRSFEDLIDEDQEHELSGKIEEVRSQILRSSNRKAPENDIQADEGHIDEIPWSVSQLTISSQNSKIYRPLSGSSSLQQSQIPRTLSSEGLEGNYVEKDSPFFKIGRVFTMLWHENAGGKGYLKDPSNVTKGPFGQMIHSHIRRFAVVRRRHGFSWAIPINTYRRSGIARQGFNQEDYDAHAIIYTNGESPVPLPEEPYMKKKPIMVEYVSEDKKLHQASRIRFDKVFSIEHNVRVQNVGKISDQSMPWFCQYWQAEARNAFDAIKSDQSQKR